MSFARVFAPCLAFCLSLVWALTAWANHLPLCGEPGPLPEPGPGCNGEGWVCYGICGQTGYSCVAGNPNTCCVESCDAYENPSDSCVFYDQCFDPATNDNWIPAPGCDCCGPRKGTAGSETMCQPVGRLPDGSLVVCDYGLARVPLAHSYCPQGQGLPADYVQCGPSETVDCGVEPGALTCTQWGCAPVTGECCDGLRGVAGGDTGYREASYCPEGSCAAVVRTDWGEIACCTSGTIPAGCPSETPYDCSWGCSASPCSDPSTPSADETSSSSSGCIVAPDDQGWPGLLLWLIAATVALTRRASYGSKQSESDL